MRESQEIKKPDVVHQEEVEKISFLLPDPPEFEIDFVQIAQMATAVKCNNKSESDAYEILIEGHKAKFIGAFRAATMEVQGYVERATLETERLKEQATFLERKLVTTSPGAEQPVLKKSIDWTPAAIVETSIYGIMICAAMVWGFYANFSYFRGIGITTGADESEAIGLSLISLFVGIGVKYLHLKEIDPVKKKKIIKCAAITGTLGAALFYASIGFSEASYTNAAADGIFRGSGRGAGPLDIAAKISRPLGQFLVEVGLSVVALTIFLEALATFGKRCTIQEFIHNPNYIALQGDLEKTKQLMVLLKAEKKRLEEWIFSHQDHINGRLAEVAAQFHYQLTH